MVGAAHGGVGDEGVSVARCTRSVSGPWSTPLGKRTRKLVVLGQEPKVRASLQEGGKSTREAVVLKVPVGSKVNQQEISSDFTDG